MTVSMFRVVEIKVNKYVKENGIKFCTVRIFDKKGNKVEIYFDYKEQIEEFAKEIIRGINEL